jgi:hypothetical protein
VISRRSAFRDQCQGEVYGILGSGWMTAYPEVIPTKCGSVRVGENPSGTRNDKRNGSLSVLTCCYSQAYSDLQFRPRGCADKVPFECRQQSTELAAARGDLDCGGGGITSTSDFRMEAGRTSRLLFPRFESHISSGATDEYALKGDGREKAVFSSNRSTTD